MFDDIVEVMVENVGLVSDVAMFAAGLETEINLHKLNGFWWSKVKNYFGPI